MPIRVGTFNQLIERITVLEAQVLALQEAAGLKEAIPPVWERVATTSATNEPVAAVKVEWGDLDHLTVAVLEGAGFTPATTKAAADDALLAISGVGASRLNKIREALS
jgi:hypothetical protein